MNRKSRAMLVERGIKHKDIAEALDLSRTTVSVVINGHQKSERVQRYIAQLLGEDYNSLWSKAA